MWAAFWMLGNNIDKVGWAQCGEIDIMENIGREPSTVHGTIHGPQYSGANGIGGSYNLPENQRFADGFHIYAVEWKKGKIKFFVDGNLYKTITPKDLPPGREWVYDHPFFMILNLAIGGPWGGSPDETTVFPGIMQIDYVRVYKR
jgi:beta-glucanase (GH16 family)